MHLHPLCACACARTDDFVLHFMAHRAGAKKLHPITPDSDLIQAWPQLGLVVSKRFAKHAVRRNLIKRLAREHFRQNAGQLSAGLWVVRLNRSINGAPPQSKPKASVGGAIGGFVCAGAGFRHADESTLNGSTNAGIR